MSVWSLCAIYVMSSIHRFQKVQKSAKSTPPGKRMTWPHLWVHPTLQLGRYGSKHRRHLSPRKSGLHLIPIPAWWTHYDWCSISSREGWWKLRISGLLVFHPKQLHFAHEGSTQKKRVQVHRIQDRRTRDHRTTISGSFFSRKRVYMCFSSIINFFPGTVVIWDLSHLIVNPNRNRGSRDKSLVLSISDTPHHPCLFFSIIFQCFPCVLFTSWLPSSHSVGLHGSNFTNLYSLGKSGGLVALPFLPKTTAKKKSVDLLAYDANQGMMRKQASLFFFLLGSSCSGHAEMQLCHVSGWIGRHCCHALSKDRGCNDGKTILQTFQAKASLCFLCKYQIHGTEKLHS